MNMNLRHGRTLTILPAVAALLLVLLIPTTTAASTGLMISNFYVTPYSAPLGARVTASITVHNLDTANPASVSVSISDGGITVANSRTLNIPAGGSATTQLIFKTATGPAHCYLVSTSPSTVAGPTGYCEAGRLLGGTAVALNTLALITPYLALGAVAVGVFAVIALSRRRKN